MPSPKNPTLAEFYVYRLEVSGIPFYVGLGRSSRASDRLRYVRSMMAKADRGEPVKWSISCAVVAGLLQSGCDVTVVYPSINLTRSAADAAERTEIARLVATGTTLANIHHNSSRPRSARDVIRAVLTELKRVGTAPAAARL